jgi:hypothetical protein
MTKEETTKPIAENRRARFDYHIEERYEAGMVLTGWEIKAMRAGQVQLTDGYVVIKDGELFLIGCRINALRSASTHVNPEADRTRKLLDAQGRDQALGRQGGAKRLHAWFRWICTTKVVASKPKLPWPKARRSTTNEIQRRRKTGTASMAG